MKLKWIRQIFFYQTTINIQEWNKIWQMIIINLELKILTLIMLLLKIFLIFHNKNNKMILNHICKIIIFIILKIQINLFIIISMLRICLNQIIFLKIHKNKLVKLWKEKIIFNNKKSKNNYQPIITDQNFCHKI